MAPREDHLNPSAAGQSDDADRQAEFETSSIQEDIDRTRARMDQTIDELGTRLSPRHWFESVMDTFRGSMDPAQMSEMGKNVGSRVYSAVRAHPVPALCIGVGVAWLIAEQIRARRSETLEMYGGSYVDARTGERYTSDYGSEFKGDIGEMSQQSNAGEASGDSGSRGRMSGRLAGVRQRLGKVTGYVREHSPDVSGYVQRGYRSTSQTISSTVDEYPLAAAGGALALGLLAGLAMPACSWENRVMGPTAEQLKRRAKETGREIYEDSKRILRETADKSGLRPDDLKHKAQEIAEDLKDCAVESAQEVAENARRAAKEGASELRDTAGKAVKGRKNRGGNGSEPSREPGAGEVG